MRIFLGSDKSGFSLKEFVKTELIKKGYEVEDGGTTDIDKPKTFYQVAPEAAKGIKNKSFDRAILFCGTGMGMAIVANKFKGVYAAVVESVYAAKKCRAINDANILTMGGWIIGEMMGAEIAEAFLTTDFTEGLEPWRQDFLINAKKQVEAIEIEAD